MRIRFVIFFLACLALVATGLGGWVYVTSLKRQVVSRSHSVAEARVGAAAEDIARHLEGFQAAAERLAGAGELAAAAGGDGGAVAAADRLLDVFSSALPGNVCYLMNAAGVTVAATNRGTASSFVGKDYSFRPYFAEAMRGGSVTYAALGVTSGQLGVYFSHALPAPPGTAPAGVVVIKVSIDLFESTVRDVFGDVVAVVDEHGVVFASNRAAFRYRLLWPLPPAAVEEIARSRQYGDEPLSWSGLTREGDAAVDGQGAAFTVHEAAIATSPGWRVVFLHSRESIDALLAGRFFSAVTVAVVGLTLFVGVAGYVLYRVAGTEMERRRRAEEEQARLIGELQEALAEVQALSGMLPICASCKKVRDDKGYWNQIEVYIQEHSEAVFSHGICPDCAAKLYPDYYGGTGEEKG